MMRKSLFALAALTALVAAAPAFKIDNTARPAEQVARDADRKPLETAAFARIGKGQIVVDILPGGGYFTRVFSQIVGPQGKVVALVAAQYAKAAPKARTDIEALAAEPSYSNVEVAVRDLTDIGPASSVDRVFTAQNYHDMHGKTLPADFAESVNRAAFAALKPGGYYIVIDHHADAGSGLRDVGTLHRIDAATVKAEVTSVGFKFDGKTKLLAHPADDRTKNVFDKTLRGKTDQFAYRFVKPKK